MILNTFGLSEKIIKMRKYKYCCPVCKTNNHREYDEKYDLAYCKKCNEWIEPITNCNDPNCEFCQARKTLPKRPN